MGKARLADAAVRGLECKADRPESIHFDADLPGFGIRVTATGRRIWIFQYNVGPARRRHIIGDWPTVTASAARKAAEKLRGQSRGGADPVAERNATRRATLAAEAASRARDTADAFTVNALIEDWTEKHLVHRSLAYRRLAPARLRTLLALHLSAPADRLDRQAARHALDKLADRAGPIAANRARAYARACFSWAVKRDTLPASPFASLPAGAPERSRDRVLSDDETARVWRASGGLVAQWRDFIRMLILTGQRRSEVAGMRWPEVAADAQTWTIPPKRAKNSVAHDVPLSTPVTALLEGRPRFPIIPWVFSDGRHNAPSGFAKAKAELDRLLREPDEKGKPTRPALPHWTLHDLRRTLATGLQRLGTPLPVTEAVLNHVSGSRAGITGVYQRHGYQAEKRAALDAWAKHIQNLINPENLVTMPT